MNFASKLKISIIVALYHNDLTEWEENFIRSVKEKTELSEKQNQKINEIWKSLRSGNRDFDFEKESHNSPFSESLGLAYDDVHNFDK